MPAGPWAGRKAGWSAGAQSPAAPTRGGDPCGRVPTSSRIQAMDGSAASRWTLISVLFSSVTLSASLAATLHQAALDLYRRDEPTGQVAGELMTGRVVNRP